MNYYIVVEGARTEPVIFRSWIPILNPNLSRVDFAKDLTGSDKFYILSGNGFPGYLKVIENAARDVSANPNYGTLVVSVDAEDDDPAIKLQDIERHINSISMTIPRKIIVQDCCIESWLLGNRRFVASFPTKSELRQWKAFYDVRNLCPERMPADLASGKNRAQTALSYFKCAIQDRNPSLYYSKKRPKVACNEHYLKQLKERARETGHLCSFSSFVGIF